jgi:hypothetical protein
VCGSGDWCGAKDEEANGFLIINVPPSAYICIDADLHGNGGGGSGSGGFGGSGQGVGGAGQGGNADGTPHFSTNLGQIDPALNSTFPPGTNDFAHFRTTDLAENDFKVERVLHPDLEGTLDLVGYRTIAGFSRKVRQFNTLDGMVEVIETETRRLQVEVTHRFDLEPDGPDLKKRKAGASPVAIYLLEDPTPTDHTDKALKLTETRDSLTRSTTYSVI